MESIAGMGLLDTLTADTDLTGEVRALHTPGHTPGHMSILVSSQGQEALIQGDVLVHPAQVTEDDWNCHFDHDWPVSTDTRRKMLADAEAKGRRWSPATSPRRASAPSCAAKAGATGRSASETTSLHHSRESGNPGVLMNQLAGGRHRYWIPAFAGMTGRGRNDG